MSKLNKILGVFIFLLVVSSCSKDDDDDEKETFEINGTYKVDKVSKGDADVAGSSGSFTVSKQSGDKVQLVSTKLTLGTLIKDMPMNLLGDITEIDSKAYKIEVGDLKAAETQIDFAYSIPLTAAQKATLGISAISADKIDFSSSAKKMTFNVDFKPAAAKKITYGGKDYTGVIQKSQIKLAMNINAVAKITITQDDLVESIGDSAIKAVVKNVLGYSGADLAEIAKKQALVALITQYRGKLASGIADKADWTITLKKQ